MTKYLNKQIYTDVESWMVTDIDEEKGTAVAIEVEKRIKPFAVPGGFCAYFPNLHEEFAEARPVAKENAKPFAITRNRNGEWGFMHDCARLCITEAQLAITIDEFLANNPAWTEVEKNSRGERVAVLYDRTPKGKIKRHFTVLGRLDDDCRYFHDYNF